MEASQAQMIESVYRARAPLLGDINRRAPWHALHRRRTMEILSSHLQASTSVLDLACGTGILATRYAPQVGDVTLVDLLPSMIELAREALAESMNTGKIDYHACAVESLPAAVLKRRYDIILITQALNFFERTSSVFRAAATCLSERGILHIDIDNPLRWVIIEALSGQLENATAIATRLRDIAHHIVGTDYWFHTRHQLVREAESNGLTLCAEHGICTVSSLLHIFNQSSDFLTPEELDGRARHFVEEPTMEDLYRLELAVEQISPIEAAGWTVLQFQRKGSLA